MKKIVKTCKIHGDLEEKDTIKHSVKNDPRYKAEYTLRCKKCRNEKGWRFGRVCKTHGELGPEDVKKNGFCKKCHRLSANSKRNSNREWFNAKMAEDRLKNPEKWKERYKKVYQYNLKKMGPALRNTVEIARRNGLSQDDYEKLFEEQSHKCKICNMPETRKHRSGGIMRLVVDHCHTTNKVRGLLCAKCNLMIGYAEDSVDKLEMAIIYLSEHSP